MVGTALFDVLPGLQIGLFPVLNSVLRIRDQFMSVLEGGKLVQRCILPTVFTLARLTAEENVGRPDFRLDFVADLLADPLHQGLHVLIDVEVSADNPDHLQLVQQRWNYSTDQTQVVLHVREVSEMALQSGQELHIILLLGMQFLHFLELFFVAGEDLSGARVVILSQFLLLVL